MFSAVTAIHDPMARVGRTVTLTAAMVLTVASAASSQYFGQNKVQYKKFDFKVLKTEHFDIFYYPSEQPGTELAPLSKMVSGII